MDTVELWTDDMEETPDQVEEQEEITNEGTAQEEGQEEEPEEEEEPSEEPQEEEEPEEVEEEPGKEPEGSDEDSDLISFNYNYLKEQGALMLPDDYEFDGTEEGLQKAIQDSDNYRNQLVANAIYEQMPTEEGKALFQYLYNGGDNIQEFVQKFSDSLSIDKEKATLTQKKQLLTDYYKRTTRFSDDRIQRELDRLEDSMDLDKEFESAYEELENLQQEERQAFLKEQEKQKAQAEKEQAEYTKNFQKAFEKADLPKATKERIAAYFNPVEYGGQEVLEYQKVTSEIQQNPEHFIQFLSLLSTYDPKKGFSLDAPSKETKNAKSLKEALKRAKKNSDSKSKMRGSVQDKGDNRTGKKDEPIETIELLF